MSLLFQAVKNEDYNQFRLLLDLGYDINVTDEDAKLSLSNAVFDVAKSEMILFLLEQGAKPDILNEDGDAPIHLAIINRSLEITELLIMFGTDVNIKGRDKRSLVMHAEFQNQTDTLSLLLHHGANLNVMNNDGNTPIHDAAYSNSAETLKMLIEMGLSVNEKSGSGQLPLHHASFQNSQDASELLVKPGADVNAQDDNGNTPLHSTIEKNAVDIAALLVKNGASAIIKNKLGESPVLVASGRIYGHSLLKLFLQQEKNLEDNDNEGSTALHHAVYGLAVQNVSELLDAGANFDSEDNKGRTPIFECVDVSPSDIDFNRKNEMLKLLLEHDCIVNKCDDENNTPLSIAVKKENLKFIKLLLDQGATPAF